MKIEFPCLQCFFGEHNPEGPGRGGKPTSSRPIGNTSLYNIKCDNGHQYRIMLMNHKFEILFESGIEALKDGYHREAVTSFAVSLERFYEFSIIYFLMDKFLDEQGLFRDLEILKQFEKFWRVTLKQSERQIGAYTALYSLEFNTFPQLIDNQEFRNKVIHAGYIPSYKEALDFGEKINEYIRGLIKILFEKDEGKPYRRILQVNGVSAALDLIKLKQPIIYGNHTSVDLFIQAKEPSYFNGSQSLANYIEAIPV